MAYVAVKGGERAIRNAHAWLAEERRGDPRAKPPFELTRGHRMPLTKAERQPEMLGRR